jgi:hypothetical protein
MNITVGVVAYLAMAYVIVAPRADATCHGSPSHLGTDNVPTTASDRDTSIVNMWFVAKSSSEPALFWIYQTENGKTWIQSNAPEATIRRADANELQRMRTVGVFPCFSKPFPSDAL